MRMLMSVTLVTSVSGFALGWATLQSANADDMPPPDAQYQAPPQPYAPPPPPVQRYAYPPPPPPVVYAYPPPPPVAYYAYPAPRYVGWPGPYYVPGPYWRGYGPRFAYGYGHWGRGWR